MRVISGTRRGRKLCEIEGMDIRPTTDRVKESMFNLIQGMVAGCDVLDAFGGSGALGIEALSRGAKSAVCVDRDEKSLAVAKKNYQMCDFSADFVLQSANAYLEKTDKHFDIVFMDPPYNKGLVPPALEIIKKRNLLNDGGIIVIERDSTEDKLSHNGYTLLKERKYGRTIITILGMHQKET